MIPQFVYPFMPAIEARETTSLVLVVWVHDFWLPWPARNGAISSQRAGTYAAHAHERGEESQTYHRGNPAAHPEQ